MTKSLMCYSKSLGIQDPSQRNPLTILNSAVQYYNIAGKLIDCKFGLAEDATLPGYVMWMI